MTLVRLARYAPLLAAALGSAGCAAAAPAVPVETMESHPAEDQHVTARTMRYAVHGTTIHELRDTMTRIGPIDDGNHEFAFTWANFAWHFHFATDLSAGACSIDGVKLEAEVVQTFPAAVDVLQAPARVEWDRWLAAVGEHENGHRDIALTTATKLQTDIAALPPEATCPAMQRAGDVRGQQIILEMRLAHASYDRRTRHGHTQGAFLHEDVQ